MNLWGRFLYFVFVFALSTGAFARLTPSGEFVIWKGHPKLNGALIPLAPRVDGSQPIVEDLSIPTEDQAGVALLSYWGKHTSEHDSSEHLVVLKFTDTGVVVSNFIATGIDFQWGDNNYVQFEGNTMYFGIYSPKRMQFIYKDGKLEVNNGPWLGPVQPHKYIEPTGDDPCFNVNGVEDCRKEVAEEAARRAKQKRQSKQKASAASH